MSPTAGEKPKRFVVFASDNYYPGGGWDDYRSSYDTTAEASAVANPINQATSKWAHVIDLQTGREM